MSDFSHPRDYMNAIIEKLESKNPREGARVKSSFSLLPSLFLHLSSSEVPAGELYEFRVKFTQLISDSSNFMGLYHYLGDCSDYAELGRLNGYEPACLMRSVLQIFNDEFVVWDEVRRAEIRGGFAEEIADIDQTLREVSDEAPPVREDDIPKWVPESHWWWHAPQQQDMSEDERKSRLEYDHWDGV
ncbi:hypothetical protein GCM10007079_25220 [Nocardiopsis terrae]|uniref:Uncharacterized protein n=3 Tax=Nocardiopsis terrae TaxID=372655 RepID=A0ABR9HFS0_9ACTN|nr:hypothetical protein [Nocardiopsis terrae]GHC83797.1 hypothetical protein GCM10007079_25220 [Nocardiopsis terrae]